MNRSLTMNRFLAISYGAASYVAFLAAFVYAVGFVAATGVPRSVSHRLTAPPGQTVAVNVLLLGVFAVQHSVMARQAFKRWWTRFVPPAIERSTYVAVVKCRAISAVLAMANGPSSGVGRHVARGSAGTLGVVLARVGDGVGCDLLDQPFRPIRPSAGVSGLPRKALHRPRFSCSAVCTDSCATRSCSASSSPSGPHRR
jgi:hypothetical protein